MRNLYPKANAALPAKQLKQAVAVPVIMFLATVLLATIMPIKLFGQAPTITSFSPLSGAVGATVTITGTNFNTTAANNIVFFGATRATVSAATATSLTVTVPTGATYAPVTELNTGIFLAAYSNASFLPTYTPNAGHITTADIAPKVDFATGTGLAFDYTVAIGDIDGDGKPDLVIANQNTNTVSVLLNTSIPGKPSFAAKKEFATGVDPITVAIGDIDGDGKPDLVINYGSGDVSVLRNTSSPGSLSFAPKMDFATAYPIYVAIGDLDGDGKPDLVFDGGSGGVSVLLNTSSPGNLSFAAEVDFGIGGYGHSVAIGDIDGDGKPDLVTANEHTSTVSVLLNTSSPGYLSFAPNKDFATGAGPIYVAIGDLDGDGKPDLVTANDGYGGIIGNTVSVLLQNTGSSGSLSFALNKDFATGALPTSVAIGDIDGDGKPDLVTANSNVNTVSVLRNMGSHGSADFAAKVDFATGTDPYSVAIGDIDGDGKPDLVTANIFSNTVSVLLNTPQLPTTIASFSPTTGPVGTLVTITGTSLSNPTAFSIGGQTAIVVSNTGTVLVGMVMPGATTGPILLTTAGGTVTSSGTFTVTPTPYPSMQQGSKLVGIGNTGAAFQGYSVSISADGNTAIVGGPYDNSRLGAAWVYIRSGGVWAQQGPKLFGTGAQGAAFQGNSVSLSADGNTAIVGGYQDNSYVGAAWVYTRSAGVWAQQGTKLVGTYSVGASSQGISVSLSADGNTAIVGGYGDNSSQGAAWVYTRNGGIWAQQGAKLMGTGAIGAAEQGCSVSLSADGNTAMVGGYFDNSQTGAAWVYTRSVVPVIGGVVVTWVQQGSKLVGNDGKYAPLQGSSVSLNADGTTAIVGGYQDNGEQGAAWVYTLIGGTWTQQGPKLVGTSATGTPEQGYSVSLSADGNTAIVGGRSDNSYQGAAWVYTRSGGNWAQQGKLVGTGNINNASQGWSVSQSADGTTAIVGGTGDNSNQGAAWVYIKAIPPVPPAIQAMKLIFTNTTTSGTSVSWTNGNGAYRAAFIFLGANGSALPVNNTVYTANAAYGLGTEIGTSGWYCIYNGTDPKPIVTVTGLTAGTTYRVTTVEYNGPTGGVSYLTTGLSPALVTTTTNYPTVQASKLTFTNTTFTGTTVKWTNGNGTARAAFIFLGANGSALPFNGTAYTANEAYGSGTEIGTSGWYCFYIGAGSSAYINGLTAGTTYRVTVVEYNTVAGSQYYLTTGLSPVSVTATTNFPTVQASKLNFTNTTFTGTTVSWTNGDGAARAAFMLLGGNGSAVPVSGFGYTSNTAYGSGSPISSAAGTWYCIYNGIGASVNVTGLTAGTQYQVTVVEYNTIGPGDPVYLTTGLGPANVTTTDIYPTQTAMLVNFTNTTSSSTTVNWSSGNGTARAAFILQGSNGSAVPADGLAYNAGTAYGTGTLVGTSGWYCFYNGMGSTANVTGLAANTNYRVTVVEYNTISGVQKYLVTGLDPGKVTTGMTFANGFLGRGEGISPLISSFDDSKVVANNILTPNEDGVNDTWIVKNLEFYPNNKVTVYDRGGNIVYTKLGYANDWAGTYHGSILNQGTYYYLVDLGNGSTLRGFITVVRDR